MTDEAIKALAAAINRLAAALERPGSIGGGQVVGPPNTHSFSLGVGQTPLWRDTTTGGGTS